MVELCALATSVARTLQTLRTQIPRAPSCNSLDPRWRADGREGIETCLAAMQATGHPAWAALSTAGLRALDLPGDVRDAIVLADGDAAGEAAARDCAWRWKREGRRVRIARPPQGTDFNDMLMAGAGQ